MIKCIVVDDEPIARSIVKTYIEKIPFVELAGEFREAVSAMGFLQKEAVDLLLLDINMPSLTGLEMLKAMDTKPRVIITTAYQEYALEGFELDVDDYLLKPFSFERFLKGIDRVNQLISAQKNTVPPVGHVENITVDEADKPKSIFVKSGKSFVQINIHDILFIQALGNYITIYTALDKIVVLKTLSGIQEELSHPFFMRVHKSYLVNKNCISKIEGNELFIQTHRIPIGRNYRKAVDKLVE